MNIVKISQKTLKNRNKKALKSFKKYSPIVKNLHVFPPDEQRPELEPFPGINGVKAPSFSRGLSVA